MELLKSLKLKRGDSNSEKLLLELLQSWVSLLQTIRDKTFRPLTNLRNVNDNLKGLLTKCQLVINNNQPNKYQNFKIQVELIRKSILKIEESAKLWNYEDLEDRICFLTEKIMRDAQTSSHNVEMRNEEVKEGDTTVTMLTASEDKMVQEIQVLQLQLREVQQEQSQLHLTLDQLKTSQNDLNIQLKSLQGLNGYKTYDISANYERQRQEITNLQQTFSYLQNEQASLENKIKGNMTEEKRTEVVYAFYFVTNPEVFEQQEIKRNFFTKFVKSIYDKVTSNKSVPAKITSFMSAIIENERRQARYLNDYSVITIEQITPFQYRHAKINPDKLNEPSSLKFADVLHKEREQFLKDQHLKQATSHKNTQIMAVYVFFLADANWTKRFEKFCERLHDIDKKLIMVIDCEEKQTLHKVNKDTYIRLLGEVNQQWSPSQGTISINNTIILPFSTIDTSNLNVQRAMSSYYMQCQGINIHDNHDMKQLQKINNDIVNLELQLVQLKYMKKENKHIITVQSGINQGDTNNLYKVQEQLALVNSEIEDISKRYTKSLNESNQIQKTISTKKQQRRDIQSSISKIQFQEKQKALSMIKYQKPQKQEVDIQIVVCELDLNNTMKPLKVSFDSFMTDVTNTLKEVDTALNNIQKGCEDESSASPDLLKDIVLCIQNKIMIKISQLVENSKAIIDTRI